MSNSTFNVEPVILYNHRSDTYHRGYVDHSSKELLTHESCNLDDVKAMEQVYLDLPDDVEGLQLCKRCFGSGSDR